MSWAVGGSRMCSFHDFQVLMSTWRLVDFPLEQMLNKFPLYAYHTPYLYIGCSDIVYLYWGDSYAFLEHWNDGKPTDHVAMAKIGR